MLGKKYELIRDVEGERLKCERGRDKKNSKAVTKQVEKSGVVVLRSNNALIVSKYNVDGT